MKKIVAAGTIMAILALAYGPVGAAELPAVAPMPEQFKEIKVVKPDPSVPKDIAAFLGEWEGVWKYVGATGDSIFKSLPIGEETRRSKLLVYEVSSDKIKVLYGWGNSPYTGGKGGWRLFESEIRDENGKKRFSFTGAARVEFYLENGILKGSSDANFAAEMKRID
jgi:hypothetical protein